MATSMQSNPAVGHSVILPSVIVSGLLTVLIILLIVWLIMRRRSTSKLTHPSSPLVWFNLQKQHDSGAVFDRLTMVTDNQTYFSVGYARSLMAGVRTTIISPDKLELKGEIGEGAFGKVYRGVCVTLYMRQPIESLINFKTFSVIPFRSYWIS